MLDEATVKDLSEKASRESDAKTAAELLTHLRNLIEMESDETRLRVRQILLHYRNNLSEPVMKPIVERPRNSMSSFVASQIAGMR